MCHCGQVGSENTTGSLGEVIDPGELSPATIAAIQAMIDAAINGVPEAPVDSVNGETGAVTIDSDDISDSDKTHKFTTTGDISKLAGIESGATADQTAAEILTAIKTVDGSGSGLDADTLDGHDTSFFQPSLGYTAEDVANKDPDSTFAAGSDTKYPSQRAVKTALDGKQPLTAKLSSLSALTDGGVDNFVRLGAGEADFTLQEVDGNYGSPSPSYSNVSTTTINNVVVPYSNTYTPTLTDVTNVASHGTVSELNFVQVGSMVFVSGRVNIDPTSASSNTELGISLPVSSNLSLFTHCAGVATSEGAASLSGRIVADVTNDRAALKFVTPVGESASRDWSVFFMYQII